MIDTQARNRTITVTSDWKQHDFYSGMLKGRLVSACPNINIIDLSHDIPSFNIHHAAFVVRHSYQFFPEGTIHLVMVNSELGLNSRILLTEQNNHFFVVPDNGILGLMFSSPPEKVYQVEYETQGSFGSLDCIVPTVQKLYEEKPLSEIGPVAENPDLKIALRAPIDESIINGSIIYIDSYNNVITNISEKLFERVGNGRRFEIFVQSNYNKITSISKTYTEVDLGELLGIFNSANLLEIAIRNGYAAELLNLSIGGSVRVKFL